MLEVAADVLEGHRELNIQSVGALVEDDVCGQAPPVCDYAYEGH